MSLLSSPALRFYVFGLLCTAVGAWLTEVADSLLPLSLGGAVLVMATVGLVRVIREHHAMRRDAR